MKIQAEGTQQLRTLLFQRTQVLITLLIFGCSQQPLIVALGVQSLCSPRSAIVVCTHLQIHMHIHSKPFTNRITYPRTQRWRIKNSFRQLNKASPKKKMENWKHSRELWSRTFVITALGNLKQKGGELWASLDYITRTCLKTKRRTFALLS